MKLCIFSPLFVGFYPLSGVVKLNGDTAGGTGDVNLGRSGVKVICLLGGEVIDVVFSGKYNAVLGRTAGKEIRKGGFGAVMWHFVHKRVGNWVQFIQYRSRGISGKYQTPVAALQGCNQRSVVCVL